MKFKNDQQRVNVDGKGDYSFGFETSNGIKSQEGGEGGQFAAGGASWYTDDGEPVQLSYVADHNGYRPIGSHIPTSPPIPAAIARALEWAKTHPYVEKDEEKPKKKV